MKTPANPKPLLKKSSKVDPYHRNSRNSVSNLNIQGGGDMVGSHIRFGVSPQAFLGQITDAAYRVALKHGLKDPFIDVELDLYDALRKVMAETIEVSPACGSPECLVFKNKSFGPWSGDAETLFENA
jgi:hypothetical protein